MIRAQICSGHTLSLLGDKPRTQPWLNSSNLEGTTQVTLWLGPSVPWGPVRGGDWYVTSRYNETSLRFTATLRPISSQENVELLHIILTEIIFYQLVFNFRWKTVDVAFISNVLFIAAYWKMNTRDNHVNLHYLAWFIGTFISILNTYAATLSAIASLKQYSCMFCYCKAWSC